MAALSVDDEATTQELITKHGLRFPVGHSADARAIAAATRAFVKDDPVYLQSTGFVLDPGGRVVVSVYSSGAIGRLIPDDILGLIRYLRDHTRPANPSERRQLSRRPAIDTKATLSLCAPAGRKTRAAVNADRGRRNSAAAVRRRPGPAGDNDNGGAA